MTITCLPPADLTPRVALSVTVHDYRVDILEQFAARPDGPPAVAGYVAVAKPYTITPPVDAGQPPTVDGLVMCQSTTRRGALSGARRYGKAAQVARFAGAYVDPLTVNLPTSRARQVIADPRGPEVGPWEERALCSQVDPEAFFPERGGSTREAKRICGRCEVAVPCLAKAIEIKDPFGVRGGLSERQRRVLISKGVTAEKVLRMGTTSPVLLAAGR
jgi:WhiB family redox-sensing transcriptional regulator